MLKKPLKIIPAGQIIFTVNILLITIIFILLSPSTQIVASWFPQVTAVLWVFPISVLIICTALWLWMQWNLNRLIQQGVFEERRKIPRPEISPQKVRFLKIVYPMIVLLVQLFFVIVLCMVLIDFMSGEKISGWLNQIAVEHGPRS